MVLLVSDALKRHADRGSIAASGQAGVAERFHIAVYSADVPDAREIALGTGGTVFVGSSGAGKGKVLAYEPLITGFEQDESAWGRPSDVQPLPDGSVLVSNDLAGAAYRVTYGHLPST